MAEPPHTDKRPLPDGWIVQWDPQHNQHVYVDIRQDPPRTLYVHPADEEAEERKAHAAGTNLSSTNTLDAQNTGTSFSSNNPYRDVTTNNAGQVQPMIPDNKPVNSPAGGAAFVHGGRSPPPPEKEELPGYQSPPGPPVSHDTKPSHADQNRDLVNPPYSGPEPSHSKTSKLASLLHRSPSAKRRKEEKARAKEEQQRQELSRLQALEQQRTAQQMAYYQQNGPYGPQQPYVPGQQYPQGYPQGAYGPQGYGQPMQGAYGPPMQGGYYGPGMMQQQQQRRRFPGGAGGAAAGLGGGLLLGGLGGMMMGSAMGDGFGDGGDGFGDGGDFGDGGGDMGGGDMGF